MAITKALIFEKVTINGVDLTPHLADSAEVTVEAVNQTVINNQTLPSAYDVSFSVQVLDTNATNNAYTDTSSEPVLTNCVFTGVSGSATLNITNVFVTATPDFSGERVAFTLTGSKRVTTLPTTVDIS
jgi:hypothetical protein